MKRRYSVIFILLAFIIAFGCFTGFSKVKAFADTIDNTFSSKSTYLMDAYTGTVVLKHNETKRLPIASMCKIMTLLLCFEAIDNGDISYDELITISENSSGMGGSQIFLETNRQYIVGDLIKGIVVASANDASVAMAERLCGSESEFVELMNKRANELGMNDTVFVNCTGLPKVGQYSCAKDVAKMFAELITHEDYFKFSKIWTDVIKHSNGRETGITNTNKLVRFYEGCDGGKTGYTSEAGHCLVASAKRCNTRLISVVISAPDSKTRFKEVSLMLNYGFANYVNKLIVDNEKPLEHQVSVIGGKKDSLETIAEKPLFIFSHKNEKRSFEVEFLPQSNLKAPITKGQNVGQIFIYENNVEIAKINVLANEDIEVKSYFDIVNDICNEWAII
jgi:D-alanyl-D-alanine carboxypeptidase (penicillin-binding protein 5/6)